MSPSSNPFATRFVRPGSLPYFFGDDGSETLGSILARLRDNAWRGEIIGPHGSGKTTLLVQLLQAARDAGGRVTFFSLNDRQRRLPRDWQSQIGSASFVAIDGYEQLGGWARWRLKRFCRSPRIGLVVTAHAPTGLPTLYRTHPCVATARKVVEQLLPAAQNCQATMSCRTCLTCSTGTCVKSCSRSTIATSRGASPCELRFRASDFHPAPPARLRRRL